MNVLTEIAQAPPPVPVLDQQGAFISLIDRLVRDPAVDVDKLERMISLRDKALNQEAEREFNEALAKAQSEMGRVSADCNNSQTMSRYASYAAIDRALRPIYSAHGIALSFTTEEGRSADEVRIICLVSKGAYSRNYSMMMPCDGKGARGNGVMTKTHATGSAVTYGMRYLLKMIFNVAIGEDDDDGNKAGRRAPPTPARNVMPPYDPRTGEIIEYQSQSTAGRRPPLSSISGVYPVESGSRTASRVGGENHGGGDDPVESVSATSESHDEAPSENAPQAASEGDVLAELMELDRCLGSAAQEGMRALEKAWKTLTPRQQFDLKKLLDEEHKPAAVKADERRAR